MNRQLLDSQGPILGMTPTQALTAIQTMADHSQKWHDGTSSRNISSSSNTDGLAAIQLTKELHSRKTNGAPSSSTGQCKVVNDDHETSHRSISLSASVNVMPRNIFEYLRLANLRNTNILVEMADMTKKAPLEIDQLADEYELGIGKKGHMPDKIWEYCKDVHRDSTYWWHDHGFEEEEHDEMGIEIEKYDPPDVQVETFEVKKYSFKGG
ncbi:hypothetical protein Tco_1443318 [Tanacetum coccineum]